MTDINKLEQMVVDIEADVSDHIIMSPSVAQEHAQAIRSVISKYRRMEEALRECADDLENEIKARADGELPRRIARDMEVVTRARQALQDE